MVPQPIHLTPLLSLILGLATGVGVVCAPSTPTRPTADPPPLPPSPITLFRQLLATNDAARAEALLRRPKPQRRALQAKLLEYQALPDNVRERRLQATEFRWYLRLLLKLSPTNRAGQLAMIPETYREVARTRIARWDALPKATQQDLLGYDRALTWLAQRRLIATANAPTPPAPPPPPPELSPQLEQQLAHWNALAPSQRDALCRQFEAFFDLPDSTRQRALEDFSAQERKAVEATLGAFAKLPPAQRALCIRSFRKFTELSSEERRSFLQTADRWREMTATERDQWRRLVTTLPPLPPGFNTPPPLPPPIPTPRAPLVTADPQP